MVQLSWWKYRQLYLRKGGVKGVITLKPPIIFHINQSMMLTGWHTHLSYDWWGLPSGEAALALYCWQALGDSQRRSLDWTIVEVTLGPDSGGQCMGLGCSVLGITWGQGLGHLPQPMEESKGKGLHWGQRKAGAQARDLGWPKRSPRGKAYVEGNGKLGLGCMDHGKKQDLGWPRSPRGKAYVEGSGKLGLSV